ncbi:MAG: hypothetical protein JXR19_06780 [Bacteroidia bacterium]
MKSLKKLLWIQLFFLSVLSTASVLVKYAPEINQDDLVISEEAYQINQAVSSR